MTGLEYGLFDCDTHCYETRDSFIRYLPETVAAIRHRAGAAARRHRTHSRRRPDAAGVPHGQYRSNLPNAVG